MIKSLICINCPRGCHLTVDYSPETGKCTVTGNHCPRGVSYATQEMTDPRRTVTGVVRTTSPTLPLLPVRTAKEFPKSLIPKLLNHLYTMTVTPPLAMGDVVLPNALDTGIDVIATEPLDN